MLFGFWRGKRLRGLEPRLKASGKYELANLILTGPEPIGVAAMTGLVKAAMALNAEFGDPTRAARTGL